MTFSVVFPRLRCLIGTLVSSLLFAVAAHAEPFLETFYDPDVPTLQSVVGHESGEQISSVGEIQSYFNALEDYAPDQVKVFKYAESWQGRDLLYIAISSAENLARMDEVKSQMALIAAGTGLSENEVNSVAEDIPAVVWLSYGVHGDEITPPDSSVAVAYHLLAAQNDPLVDRVLDNVIVIIDPSQNPDGRDRFIHSFYSSLGLEALADRHTAEHDQPWPRGRTNHYLFDLNRDWFTMSQPETQGKVAAVLEWNPVVYVDSHEMSGDSTYYFPPPADPVNPNIPQEQRERLHEMGENHGRWFDEHGVRYFTREVYDAFYPGYGDMWPMLNGATAMTFEQASPRGLLYDRTDGDQLSYRDGVRNNFLTSLSTLEVVSGKKADYLKAYAAYRSAAVRAGETANDRYIVMDRAGRTHEAELLARQLAKQGIKVQRMPVGSEACGSRYSEGGFVVDLAQPQGRLIRTLLTKHTALPEDFVEEQEARRDAGLNHELYDVTAWSLPLMNGVASTSCRSVRTGSFAAVSADDPMSATTASNAGFGIVVPWTDSGQAKLVIAALKAGLVGRTTDEDFIHEGRSYPKGSVVFSNAENQPGLAGKLAGMAAEFGAKTVGMSSSWVSDGPNFGSYSFAKLKMPKIAMAWGEGTSSLSAGNSRFVIERELGLPVSPIRVSALGRADLSQYDVIILPEAGWGMSDALGRAGSALVEYVEEGGVLVAFGSGIDQISTDDVSLLATKLEMAATEGGAPDGDGGSKAPGSIITTEDDYEEMIHDHRASPEDIPGVMARTIANTDHWLSSGYTEASALVTGRSIYTPLNSADGVNVFRFADKDRLVQSGYLWEENHEQLAFKPFVMAQSTGSGLTIGFTQSPTTRAYLDGLNLLLANALVLAPARVAN